MEKIKLRVTGNVPEVTERPEVITSGTVGLPVEFTFDSRWDGLHKTAVFRAGERTVAVTEPEKGTVVPWEVLAKPNVWLRIGVYGVGSDGAVVIPTLWVDVAGIYTGADPEGDPATEPTLPVWQEMQTKLADHMADATNPHGVTISQIGAAPAGFGLGENGGKVVSDYNIPKLKTGFYQAASTGAANAPSDNVAKFYNGTLLAEGRSGWLIHQKATYREYVARRYTPDGCKSWSQWEYENPPLSAGKEYRTTERFMGKPVYAKAINFGEMVEVLGEKIITLDEAVTALLRIEGCLSGEETGGLKILVPFPTPNSEVKILNGTDLAVCDMRFHGCNTQFSIYYLKE